MALLDLIIGKSVLADMVVMKRSHCSKGGCQCGHTEEVETNGHTVGEERRGLSACMPSVDAWKTPFLPALEGNQPWQTLISNFQPPEEGEDEFLWVKPHPGFLFMVGNCP